MTEPLPKFRHESRDPEDRPGVILGVCRNEDPDHVHTVVDEHPQDDLVRDGKCLQCRAELDLGLCRACELMFHVHMELNPPPHIPGRPGPACPECTVGIDKVLVCTVKERCIVIPCQHEVTPDQLVAVIEAP